jgi:hypothetical protein
MSDRRTEIARVVALQVGRYQAEHPKPPEARTRMLLSSRGMLIDLDHMSPWGPALRHPLGTSAGAVAPSGSTLSIPQAPVRARFAGTKQRELRYYAPRLGSEQS